MRSDLRSLTLCLSLMVHCLCSGSGHSTTYIAGKYQADPKGYHYTFCYKDEKQVQAGTHIACHGYTPGPGNFELTESTFAPEKIDRTIKINGKPVWPDEKYLLQGPEIGYPH
jgi:hypothetical protein